MLKTDFESKLTSLLGDISTYRKEKRDSTSKTRDAVNKLVLKWHKANLIGTVTKK